MTDRERTRLFSVRPRRVPPEWCNDELLESCSVLAALLLYRIVSLADDQGRLPGHPKYIRAVAFAMREEITQRKVAAALDELVRSGFLIRFDAHARTFLQVANWHDLQGKWGRRAYASRYPAPPGWSEDWISTKGKDDEPEVRADSTQDARTLHPPITTPPPSPITTPVTGLGSAGRASGGPTRVGDVLGRRNGREMTQEEALSAGMALLDARKAAG